MTKPLPNHIAVAVTRLFDEGETFADDEEDAEALAHFEAAWDLLPEPKCEWEPALQILVALADSYFHLGNYHTCYRKMQHALRCGGEVDNLFLRLRLGQCLFEMGDLQEAGNWLAPVYLMEGKAFFESEDPKYLAFLKDNLNPPPGGWPEGW
jgi:tetratricopeptide (TPR) repeat protein